MTPTDDPDHELPAKPGQRLPTDRIAARLTLPTGEVLEVTSTGEWRGDNLSVVEDLAFRYRRANYSVPYAYGGGAALAQAAAFQMGGTVEVFIHMTPRPPGQHY